MLSELKIDAGETNRDVFLAEAELFKDELSHFISVLDNRAELFSHIKVKNNKVDSTLRRCKTETSHLMSILLNYIKVAKNLSDSDYYQAAKNRKSIPSPKRKKK